MTSMEKPQNEECWTLSPNPTNTHSAEHELCSEGVGDINDITGIFLKKNIASGLDFFSKKVFERTRKVVRTPTNPFEAAGTAEVFVPKEIIARRIQDIFAGPNKGRKADRYLVV